MSDALTPVLAAVAVIRILTFGGETVIIHSQEPGAQIFQQCERVRKIRAGFSEKHWNKREEEMAQDALKGRRGNVINVTVKERMESPKPKYRMVGVLYDCPPDIVMQLTTEEGR